MVEPSDLAYRTDLLAIARRAQETIRAELTAYFEGRSDARTDGISDDLKALFARIRIKTSERVKVSAPIVARRFVRDTEEANRAAMNAQFKSMIKVDPFLSSAGLEKTMRSRARANVELIESIPAELVDQVEAVVVPRVVSGIRVEEIMKRVAERFDVSDSRAQLIARDQVGKFNGQLARERQESLGITEYVWSTSKDSRVRADHAELEGTVQQYADPPIVDQRDGRRANPGEDFQCRCQPLPSVSSLLDSLGVSAGIDDLTDEIT
jgi:SPP1 gp7 family putative phage head morphogenesis protein